jgi:hypothetical protein
VRITAETQRAQRFRRDNALRTLCVLGVFAVIDLLIRTVRDLAFGL